MTPPNPPFTQAPLRQNSYLITPNGQFRYLSPLAALGDWIKLLYAHVGIVLAVRVELGVVVGGRGAVDVHAPRDQPASAEDRDHAVVHL